MPKSHRPYPPEFRVGETPLRARRLSFALAVLAACSGTPDAPSPTSPTSPSSDDYQDLTAWFANRGVVLPAVPPVFPALKPSATAQNERELHT